jgi:DEAD/DEAH box helicase domain-containing protein
MSDVPTLSEFADELARWDKLRDSVVHRAHLPAAAARYAETAHPLPPQVRDVLDRLGVERLYSHQAEAVDRIRSGRDVAVVTPTASGKSLVFYLPTVEAALARTGARALYLFPYKALEQDQHQSLRLLGGQLFSGVDLSAEIYDGDTPPARRRKIKASPPDVLITNPDMLHMGILAYHADWRPFLERLRTVVVDELHVYRGIFGCHLAHVLRRLWRICGHYGAKPQVIACSATVGNPAEFAHALTGRPLDIVSDSGAPRAGRHFLFLNPEASPYTAATAVFGRSVTEGYKTIAFTKARRITELIHSWVVEAQPGLRGKVASYRAGYLPEERRRIEQRLFSGELGGVVSTSALELGIDVGGLDVCVLVGYPGSIMSAWQRIGRVGRKGRESLAVLVALPDALDQYFMKNPREFFDRPFERAVLDPDNRTIASAHLVCAGAEVPLRKTDDELYSSSRPVIEDLVRRGRLLRDAAGEALFSLRRRPQRDISLRSTGQSYTIVDGPAGRTIGSIDGVRVFHECHEGAVYLHGGSQYLVKRLDTDNRRVEAEPCDLDYYTQAIGDKETEILETWSVTGKGKRSTAGGGSAGPEVGAAEPLYRVGLGRLKVTVRISGYERRRIFGQEILSRHPLECPPIVFETVGFWLVIPEALEMQVTRADGHFMGALHASEHAMISLFPLLALCDRGDVGGISYSRNAQLGSPAIFIYDGYPGGIGLAAGVHEELDALVDRTRELLEGCPCDDGCPSCVQSPKCGSGNRPLDKEAAKLTLSVLAGTTPLEEESGLVQSGAPSDTGQVERVDSSPLIQTAASSPVAPRPRPEDGRLLFFDLETQRSAEEVGGWSNITAMGLALGVVYEPAREEYRTYLDRDVERLLVDLLAADKVVGFNIDRFDIPVLTPYTPHDLSRIRTFDMLTHIHDLLGIRISLGHLAEVNLGEGKSADGLQSLRWYREGRMDLIETYCRKDVEITARLFYLGRERGYLLFSDQERGQARVPVSW